MNCTAALLGVALSTSSVSAEGWLFPFIKSKRKFGVLYSSELEALNWTEKAQKFSALPKAFFQEGSISLVKSPSNGTVKIPAII